MEEEVESDPTPSVTGTKVQLLGGHMDWNFVSDLELLKANLFTSTEQDIGKTRNLISAALNVTQNSGLNSEENSVQFFVDGAATQRKKTFVRNPLQNHVILNEVMRHLPLESLLKFRSVNRNWNATAVRGIHLKTKNVVVNPENVTRFFADFEKANILPFTKLDVLLVSMPPEECLEFFTKHGSVIRELRIQERCVNSDPRYPTNSTGELEKLRQILGFVPKLKKLSLNLKYIPKAIRKFYDETNMKNVLDVTLSQVEYLELSSRRIPLSKEFLNCLFKTSLPNVKIVEIGKFRDGQDWEGLVNVLKNQEVHTIHRVDPDSLIPEPLWSPLAAGSLRLRELSIMILVTEEHLDDLPLQRGLLDSQSEYLEVLNVTITSYNNSVLSPLHGIELPKLQFPVMKTLKAISFLSSSKSSVCSVYPYPLVPVTPEEVPNLETVYMEKELVDAKLFANESFTTVHEVNFGAWQGSCPKVLHEVGTRFPNLRKLSNVQATISEIDWIETIVESVVTKLGDIEDLELKMTSDPSDVGVYWPPEREPPELMKYFNFVISGVPVKSAWAVSQLAARVGFATAASWIDPPGPSLRDLKHLRRLVLSFNSVNTGNDNKDQYFTNIDEIGVFLTFLRLSPTLQLSLRGDFTIPVDLAERLKDHFQTIYLTPTMPSIALCDSNASSDSDPDSNSEIDQDSDADSNPLSNSNSGSDSNSDADADD